MLLMISENDRVPSWECVESDSECSSSSGGGCGLVVEEGAVKNRECSSWSELSSGEADRELIVVSLVESSSVYNKNKSEALKRILR